MGFHEPLEPRREPPRPKERVFGLGLALGCTLAGTLPLLRHAPARVPFLAAAAVVAVLAAVFPRALAPLGYAVFWVSMRMSRLIVQVLLALVFVLMIVPMGALRRLTSGASGKDPLGLRLDRSRSSYWSARTAASQDFTRPF
ncbi:MAG: hypothetical protein ACXVCH_17265 [Bdellovibrionota bacterium]